MIKEIKTSKFEGLAVLMPNYFVSAFANMGYLVIKVMNEESFIHDNDMFPPSKLAEALSKVSKLPEYKTLPAIKLPDGEFKVMGIATKLTEEQYATIVEEVPLSNGLWRNYCEDQISWMGAKNSFISLLAINEVYEKNPYGNKPLIEANNDPIYNNIKALKQNIEDLNREKAQRNVGTWIILKKL